MATITSDVFRFVSLRAPVTISSIVATPTTPIGVVKEKPTVMSQEDWDNTLIQKMKVARAAPENENNQRQAMLDVLANQDGIDKIYTLQVYSNPVIHGAVGLFEYIIANADSLDKTTLRDKMIEVMNLGDDAEATTIANFSDKAQSADVVAAELALWGFFATFSLYLKRQDLAEGTLNLLRLIHLGKQLADFDSAPTASADLYAIFKTPIEYPTDIFPLPAAPAPAIIPPTTDPRDAQLATAKVDLANWQAVQVTIDFVREQLREKQQQLLHDFVLTYDAQGFPTNLNDTPKVEQEYLTAASLTENTQRCATTIAATLTAGKDLLTTQYLCTEESRYSFEYIEKEIKANIKKLQATIATLTPYTVTRTVNVNGTIMQYDTVKRGKV